MYQQHTNTTSYVDGLCKQVFDNLYASRLNERRRHIREMKARATRGPPNRHTSGPRRRSVHPELPSLDHNYIQELDQLCYGHNLSTGGAALHLDRALVHLAYAHGQYERAHFFIRQMAPYVPSSLETELETIWDNSSYHIYGSNLLLNSVNKYRIRKRFVCPTVLRSGGKKYKLSRDANARLSQQFAIDPKPERTTREQLSNELGISMPTISNWFKNRRQRVRCDLINTNTLCSTSESSSVASTQSSDSSSSIVSSPSVHQYESPSPSSQSYYVYQQPTDYLESHQQQQQQLEQIIYYIPPEQLVERAESAPSIIPQIPIHQHAPSDVVVPKLEYIEQQVELCSQPVVTCESKPVVKEEMVNTMDQWFPPAELYSSTPEQDLELFNDLIYDLGDPCPALDYFCY